MFMLLCFLLSLGDIHSLVYIMLGTSDCFDCVEKLLFPHSATRCLLLFYSCTYIPLEKIYCWLLHDSIRTFRFHSMLLLSISAFVFPSPNYVYPFCSHTIPNELQPSNSTRESQTKPSQANDVIADGDMRLYYVKPIFPLPMAKLFKCI